MIMNQIDFSYVSNFQFVKLRRCVEHLILMKLNILTSILLIEFFVAIAHLEIHTFFSTIFLFLSHIQYFFFVISNFFSTICSIGVLLTSIFIFDFSFYTIFSNAYARIRKFCLFACQKN